MPLDSSKEQKEPEKKADASASGSYSASQFVGDLLRSAAYSAVAAPTEGALQIVDQVKGTNFQGRSRESFAAIGIAAPQADVAGAKWLAQTIGQAGMAVPLMLLHKPVKAMLGNQGSVQMLAGRTTLGFTLRESVATGFLQGALLSPTDDKKGLLASRIDSGFASAVQFGGMTYANYKLNTFAETGLAFKYGLNRVLTNPVAAGIVSGIPGGAITAEVEAVKQGRALPTAHEVGQSMLSMSLMGGVFGGKHLLAEKMALKPSITSGTDRLLNHPDVTAVLRAPKVEVKGSAGLDKLPGMDVSQPAAIGPWRNVDGVQTADWRLGTMNIRGGGIDVSDNVSGVTRSYSGGRLIESKNVDGSAGHTYAYNSSGELRAIITAPNEGWFRVGGGWTMGRINENGRLTLNRTEVEAARLTADGVMFSRGETAWSLPVASRFVTVDSKGAELTHRDMKHEQAAADFLMTKYELNGQIGAAKYMAEDGRPLHLPQELKAFRTAAQEHGLRQGYGQLEGEVNRSLSSGNEAEALGILVAAQKLLPKEGVNSLKTMRNLDGTVSVMAEGYVDGAHMRYLLDGTTIRTGPMMRTTTYPDGSKVEESFGGSDNRTTRYNKTGNMEEIKFGSGAGDLVQKFSYDDQGQLTAVVFSRGANSTKLSRVDQSVGPEGLTQNQGQKMVSASEQGSEQSSTGTRKWILEQDTAPAAGKGRSDSTSKNVVNFGPGEVSIHADGALAFKGSESNGYLYSHDGEVRLNRQGQFLSMSPGEPTRIRSMDLERESKRQEELIAGIGPAERAAFTASSEAFQNQMERLRIDGSSQAVLLGQVNHLLEGKQTAAAMELQNALTSVLGDIQNPSGGSLMRQTLEIMADRSPEHSTVYILNKAVDIDAAGAGQITVRSGPSLRFDGSTGADFRSAVKAGLQDDLSPSVAKLLENNGIVVVAGPSAGKIVPDAAGQRPAGWPNGATNEAVGAIYDPQKRIIAVGEKRDAYVRDGTVRETTENPRLELLRAVGRAVDDITGLSKSAEFKKAFQADELELKEPEKVEFYRSKSEQENQSVLFADLFAAAQLRGRTEGHANLAANSSAEADSLRNLFPRTAKLVDESIHSLEGREHTFVKARQEAAPPVEGYPVERGVELWKQTSIQGKLNGALGQPDSQPDYMKQYLVHENVPEQLSQTQAILAGEVKPPEHQSLVKLEDGAQEISDKHSMTTRVYDAQGRLVAARSLTAGGASQRYLYADDGSLKAAFEKDGGYFHTADGWQRVLVRESTGTVTISSTAVKGVSVHPDGGLLLDLGSEWSGRMADGRKLSYAPESKDLDGADFALEKANFERSLGRIDAGHADVLLKQAEVLKQIIDATDISEGQRGSVFAELARQVERDPEVARKNLEAINAFAGERNILGMWSEHLTDGRSAIKVNGPGASYRYFSDGTVESALTTTYGKDHTVYGRQGEVLSQTFTPSSSVKRSLSRGEQGIESISDEYGYSGTYSISRQGQDFIRTYKTKDGEQTFNLGPGKLEIDRTDSIVFTPDDATKPRMVHSTNGEDRFIYSDGRNERLMMNGRRDFVGADLTHESLLLRENIRLAFGSDVQSAARIERFEKLLDEFETRAGSKPGENVQNKKALVLLQLNRLLADSPSSMFSRGQRADLAEQLLAQTLESTKIWQGAHQTCNVTTVQHRLMVQSPQRLIAMVADAVNEGGYTRTDGRRFSTVNLAEVFKPDTEASANLAKQREPGNQVLHDQGERDWASQIAQITLLRSTYLEKKLYLADNRILPDNSIGYVKDPASGKFKPVLLRPELLLPVNGRDTVNWAVNLENGNAIGRIPGKSVIPLRDKKGNWLEKLEPGDTAYDAGGRAAVHLPAPEELAFGRTSLSEDALVTNPGAAPGYLVEPNFKLVDTPQMSVTDIANAYRSVDVDSPLGANILGVGINGQNLRSVSDAGELSQVLARQKQRSELPAILLVHTRSQAFGHWHGGGFHVVNAYEPVESRLRFSNQWGSRSDYMGDGMAANILYSAMQAPTLAPDMPSIVVPISKPGLASHVSTQAASTWSRNIQDNHYYGSSDRSSGFASFGDSGSRAGSSPARWFKPQGWLSFLNQRLR